MFFYNKSLCGDSNDLKIDENRNTDKTVDGTVVLRQLGGETANDKLFCNANF